MPLRNRVTPFNDIVAVAARGTLMGNRGCLHDGQGLIRRRVCTTRSWVTCVLRFKDRRRKLLQPGRYTELFFLDEPTALAAGHRPCGECRRADYRRFLEAWRAGNAMPGAPLAEIDRRMHAERIDRATRRPLRWRAVPATLPDGAMVALEPGGAIAHLVWGGKLLRWSATGYRPDGAVGGTPMTEVLTPRSTVAALAAGYRPLPHASVATPGAVAP